jgi:hypothetical protein
MGLPIVKKLIIIIAPTVEVNLQKSATDGSDCCRTDQIRFALIRGLQLGANLY